MSGSCTQMRRKLVTHSSLNMATGETTPGRQEWVTEPCGTPLFGGKGETLCRSCLSGWMHPHNYAVADDGNSFRYHATGLPAGGDRS